MFWFVYNVLFVLGYVITFPYYLTRMLRRGGYRAGFLQRFGVYPPELAARLRAAPRIWVHAVSVGEVLVALRFIEETRRRGRTQAFLLSTTTSTGHALAAKSLHRDDVLIYFPVDFGPVLRRVLGLVRPRALVLTETELWPCAIHHCRRLGIPVLLLNGRLSGHSFNGYRRFRWFFGRVLRGIDLLCMQGQADAQRVLELGADPARVHPVGSVKFDVAQADPESARKASEVLRAAGFGESEPVIVGGSTWDGEEAALLDAFLALRARFADLRLVLVPRHVERTPQVVPELEKRKLRFVLRSALRDGGPVAPGSQDVLLVDTTGELRHLYARATVIFVGKSLTQTGGQNPIEPAVYGRPIVVGPHMENFAEIVPEFVAADAMVQVRDAAGLTAELERFLADPARREAVGQRAAAVVARQRGAFRKTLELAAGKWPEVF